MNQIVKGTRQKNIRTKFRKVNAHNFPLHQHFQTVHISNRFKNVLKRENHLEQGQGCMEDASELENQGHSKSPEMLPL